MHDELEPNAENALRFIMMKMAGEVLIRKKYGRVYALMTYIKLDRADVEQCLGKVYPILDTLDCRLCMKRAVLHNILIFRNPQVKKTIELMVAELIVRRGITRTEYLEITR